MIGLDTNVLVRYLTQDDANQSPKATALIESLTSEAPGYISLVVVVETVWVLDRGYGTSRARIGEVLETLLRSRELVVAGAETVRKALRRFKDGNADFADSLIESLGGEAGCTHTLTFDLGAARNSGMRLME